MPRFRRPILALCLLTPAMVPTAFATGSETVTYGYDERGRLVRVTRSGTTNNGVQAIYSYDRADNRTNVAVVTSGGGGGETPPSFSIGSASGDEGQNLVFTVTKSGPVSNSYSINYATANGTAVTPGDYASVSGALTFAPSETSKVISVATTDDTAVEGSESFVVNLSGASSGATISVAQGNGTIADNDTAPPSFAVNDVWVTETHSALFTVTRSGSAAGSFSVSYATSNGTALAGTNYTATSGTLTFAPGETSKTVSVQTLNDGSIQAAKTFVLNLSAPTGGATLSDGSGTATVAELGEIILYAGQSMNSPDGRFALLMQTDGNLALYGPDGYYWAAGTQGGSDRRMVMQHDGNLVVYNGVNQPLWHTGTQSPGARLALQNDGNLVIYSSSGSVLWQTSTVYYPPSFAIGDVEVVEGGALRFTVSRSKATAATYVVSYTTANGSATAGPDYSAASTSISIAPSEFGTITIPTHDDADVEGSETLVVNLSGVSGGGVIGDGQAVGTIHDNDTNVRFSISDGVDWEGLAIAFTITKSGSTANSHSVHISMADITAIGGNPGDYYASSGPITFGPAETQKTIHVQTWNDEEIEESETFSVNLSGATDGAGISDGVGIGTIRDVPPPQGCFDENGMVIDCP